MAMMRVQSRDWRVSESESESVESEVSATMRYDVKSSSFRLDSTKRIETRFIDVTLSTDQPFQWRNDALGSATYG